METMELNARLRRESGKGPCQEACGSAGMTPAVFTVQGREYVIWR